MNDIIEVNGRRFGTGLMLPPAGRVCALPAFESRVPLLSEDQVRSLARSGAADGRKLFDRSMIKNQHNHGSCNGFAGAAALTRARIRRGLPRVDLSGAYLYSLINGGRDNGSMLDDGMEAVLSRGIATEATVKWNQIYPTQYDKGKADAEASQYKGFECYAVRLSESSWSPFAGLWTALAMGFDCVVAVHVGSRFTAVNSDGIAGADAGPGNHAVMCDGLAEINGKLYGTGVNSWGTEFGQDGRMQLGEAHFGQTFGNHVFYAVRSTTGG